MQIFVDYGLVNYKINIHNFNQFSDITILWIINIGLTLRSCNINMTCHFNLFIYFNKPYIFVNKQEYKIKLKFFILIIM